ncbi:nucleotide sugar dehydrogenase [Bradyrhizobium sp. WSM1417]|uniref:nucleotide sugar dehydrogenase n=1 Tax=Bradyrhizobium sp. WSM1417 TaxID=754500 RepID=UPI0006874A3F|nr:nucleotide sugar dehydrogenase [Bradyrhizobium sp. WSM1417]
MSVDNLVGRFRSRKAIVGVIGLGYVGLPLCIAIAESGSRVIGFDIDPEKPELLANGQSYIKHIEASKIALANQSGRFQATSNFSRLREADAILICVPTPLTAHLEPDLSFVESTAAVVSANLRAGQLVVLESTTFPGTTREVLQPILEKSGLRNGVDFFLAFSPEREDPGNPDFSTTRIPKVIGSDDLLARELAVALYDGFIAKTVPVSSAATAEAVKITENIFRAVNIALVNELKIIYKKMGIDIWEVIEAAKTKPFGFMPFYPGPGLGGHCIPIDPFYLTWKAREFGIATRFIELAGEINSNMPSHVISELAIALDREFRKGLNGSRILVLGLAYKKNIDDIRESPSLVLIELLEARGATVEFYDPHVRIIPPTREHGDLANRKSIAFGPEIDSYDAVLIATDHDDVDYAALVKWARLVVDTRNACGKRGLIGTHIVSA